MIFPELSGDAEASNFVAPAFNHMIVDSAGEDPFCRLRLEARGTDDGTIEGPVEQTLYWILTAEEAVPDDKKATGHAKRRDLKTGTSALEWR